jgi:hypothetical protein
MCGGSGGGFGHEREGEREGIQLFFVTLELLNYKHLLISYYIVPSVGGDLLRGHSRSAEECLRPVHWQPASPQLQVCPPHSQSLYVCCVCVCQCVCVCVCVSKIHVHTADT